MLSALPSGHPLFLMPVTEGWRAVTTHLRAERGLFMEVAAHKVTILPCGDPTIPVDSYAARVTNHLTCHVLCCIDLFDRCNPLAADWPACYVVRPLVRRDGCRFFAVAGRRDKVFCLSHWNICSINFKVKHSSNKIVFASVSTLQNLLEPLMSMKERKHCHIGLTWDPGRTQSQTDDHLDPWPAHSTSSTLITGSGKI